MKAEREAFILQVDFRSLRAIAIEFLNLATVIFGCQSCAGSESWDSTAMESVISMMREVEVQEKAVDIVQEEASRGGLDIMVKVEELKQMLAHAKDANDMHAGEVFGEKAILATEARELQSRLLNLSDGRDKSLAILNEVDSTSLSCLLHCITVGACSISLIYPFIFRLPHFYAVFFISYSSKTTIV
ncbi:hypothetical protein ACFX1X_027077 [Malus domestica]